jgi:hypothetical protein
MEEESGGNLLSREVEYKVEQTSLGTWRRFLYPSGMLFEEFVSHRRLAGLPLFHYTRGICPETGKRVVARGIVAMGRMAVGVLALGQLALGLLAIGHLGLGLLFGLGQGATGFLAVGQLAGGVIALGQVTGGWVAVGQAAVGKYVLAQIGLGEHVWDMEGASPAAEEFFRSLWGRLVG